MMARRRWNDEEMILALSLYRFEELGFSYSQIADMIDRTADSLVMRLDNYLNAEKEGVGLDGGGARVKEFYNKYRTTSKEELKAIVLKFLNVQNSSWR